MGGIDVASPIPTWEETKAKLIEIGQNAGLKDPHTVWVVENPPATGRFFYKDRSDMENICYPIPVSHLEEFPFGRAHMELASIAFYHYREHEAAIADAMERLARVGLRCAFCHGVAHPASGCEYTPTFIVCGRCIQPYQDFTDNNASKLPKAGLPGWLVDWTNAKGRRKSDRFPGMDCFYEAAGLFLGKDNRRVNPTSSV